MDTLSITDFLKKRWTVFLVTIGVCSFILSIAVGLTCLFTYMRMEVYWEKILEEEGELSRDTYSILSHRYSQLEGELLVYQKVVKAFVGNGRRRALGIFEVTAYDPSGCIPFNDGVTSIGMPVGEGIFAVNPKVIPYGSILYIYGEDTVGNKISIYGIAGDTGAAMRKQPKLIDVFIPRNKDAKEFGRKKLNVDLVTF